MAIEIKETKKTSKYKVGDICMLTSEVSFRDKEGNLCEIPQGSVVKIRTVCAGDNEFHYCVSDCNGKPVVGTVGEWKLKLATEDNINELLKNANDEKKSDLIVSIKTAFFFFAFSFVLICLVFVLLSFYGEPINQLGHLVCKGLSFIFSILLVFCGLRIAKEDYDYALNRIKEIENSVELTRKELNIIE